MENKKIAFVAVWFGLDNNKSISEDNKFILECLYKTAKKKFLPKQDVEFVLITNTEVEIKGITVTRVDYDLGSMEHIYLMKILALRFLSNTYDYIFVSDVDQVFVGEIGENILDKDFTVLGHWCQKIKDIYGKTAFTVTLDIEEEFKDEEWILGCFFGGKAENVLDLLKLTEEEHIKYYNPDTHFYTSFPDELYLVKYVYERKIPTKRLKVTAFPRVDEEGIFLSTFSEDASALLLDNSNDMTKVLHDTKKYIQTLKDKIDLI